MTNGWYRIELCYLADGILDNPIDCPIRVNHLAGGVHNFISVITGFHIIPPLCEVFKPSAS